MTEWLSGFVNKDSNKSLGENELSACGLSTPDSSVDINPNLLREEQTGSSFLTLGKTDERKDFDESSRVYFNGRQGVDCFVMSLPPTTVQSKLFSLELKRQREMLHFLLIHSENIASERSNIKDCMRFILKDPFHPLSEVSDKDSYTKIVPQEEIRYLEMINDLEKCIIGDGPLQILQKAVDNLLKNIIHCNWADDIQLFKNVIDKTINTYINKDGSLLDWGLISSVYQDYIKECFIEQGLIKRKKRTKESLESLAVSEPLNRPSVHNNKKHKKEDIEPLIRRLCKLESKLEQEVSELRDKNNRLSQLEQEVSTLKERFSTRDVNQGQSSLTSIATLSNQQSQALMSFSQKCQEGLLKHSESLKRGLTADGEKSRNHLKESQAAQQVEYEAANQAAQKKLEAVCSENIGKISSQVTEFSDMISAKKEDANSRMHQSIETFDKEVSSKKEQLISKSSKIESTLESIEITSANMKDIHNTIPELRLKLQKLLIEFSQKLGASVLE